MDATPTSGPMPIAASRGFVDWLVGQNVSLSFTTYQGKLFFIGHNDRGGLSVFERTFERAMGLATAGASANTLYLASLCQLWRLDNVLNDGETADGYDRRGEDIYQPASWTRSARSRF